MIWDGNGNPLDAWRQLLHFGNRKFRFPHAILEYFWYPSRFLLVNATKASNVCSYSYGGWMYFTLFRGILIMFWELSRLLLSKYVLVNPALAEQPSKAIYDFHFVRSVYNY